MRRFLRPGRLVRCGDQLLVFDTYQPVAAVFGSGRLISWPSAGPAQGWMERLLCGDAIGFWAVDPPDGPLARIELPGDVTTYPMTDAQRLIGDPNGCWVVRRDDDSVLQYVGVDRSRRSVTVPGPVHRLCGGDDELLVDYQLGPVRCGPDGVAQHDIRTVAVPWPGNSAAAEGYDPVVWGSAGDPVPGRCAGLVWSRRYGRGLSVAGWNRQQALVGSDPDTGAPVREVVLDGRITAVSTTADELWVTRLRPGPPAHPTADLLRIPAGSYVPEIALSANSLDITEHRPPPSPIGDAAAVERDARDRVARLLAARRTDLRIAQVRLSGEWPETMIQVVFTHPSRPGLSFVRDIRPFDEGGRPARRLGHLSLIHDVLAVDHGLPPVTECRPNREGLVPF